MEYPVASFRQTTAVIAGVFLTSLGGLWFSNLGAACIAPFMVKSSKELECSAFHSLSLTLLSLESKCNMHPFLIAYQIASRRLDVTNKRPKEHISNLYPRSERIYLILRMRSLKTTPRFDWLRKREESIICMRFKRGHVHVLNTSQLYYIHNIHTLVIV